MQNSFAQRIPVATDPRRRARARRAIAGLASVLLVVTLGACGGSDSGGGEGATPDGGEASTTTTTEAAPAAPDDSAPPDETTAPAPADDGGGGTPAAWPADLPLPTAVDPTGAVIAGSLVTTDDPPDGDVVLFSFDQGEGTALQSAYTGVGVWAEALEDFPGGTPCLKADASAAALGGGGFNCDGMLADGRLVQISTSLADGRMALDVLIKRP